MTKGKGQERQENKTQDNKVKEEDKFIYGIIGIISVAIIITIIIIFLILKSKLRRKKDNKEILPSDYSDKTENLKSFGQLDSSSN